MMWYNIVMIDKTQKKINVGIIVLRIVCLILMFASFIKLFIVGYIQADDFSSVASYNTSITAPIELPRGEVYDAKHKLVVGNESHKSLAYIESGIMDDQQQLEVASKIASLVSVEDVYVSTDDLSDLWLRQDENLETTLSLLTEDEASAFEVMEVADQNSLLRSYIPEDSLNEWASGYSEETFYIKLKMDQATSKDPIIIEDELTLDEEYAIETIANEIGGFYVTNSYSRTYPYGSTLSGFIGTVGQIEAENAAYYEARGYSANEIVGTSYMEEELESVLHATPAYEEINFDDNGNIASTKVISSGKAGYDVVLTIDMEVQKLADKNAKEYLQTKNNYDLTDTVCMAAVNPQNGNLIYSTGLVEDGSKYYDYSTCTFTYALEVGSVVKPANQLVAFDTGVRTPGEQIYDAPLSFKGSADKASFENMGWIDDADAIARSSNVYYYTAYLEIAGQPYYPGMALDISQDDYSLVRKYLSEFGLGVSTGIEMPNENIGVQGDGELPGFYLDLANGQYDTYTPLQVAQYIATVANGGTRYKVNYVESINDPGVAGELGAIVYKPTPVILNELTMSDEHIERVRDDMHEGVVRTVGSSHEYLSGLESQYSFKMGAKTGTAESYYYPGDGTARQANNSAGVSFGPYEEPTIATAVLVPMYGSNAQLNINAGYLNGMFMEDYLKYTEE